MSKKLFVLDTCVLLSDPVSPLKFHDNDVVIPMCVLEELDHIKDRKVEITKDARAAIRLISTLLQDTKKGDDNHFITVPLNKTHPELPKEANLILFPDHVVEFDGDQYLEDGRNADNRIINVCQYLTRMNPEQQVILVTRDINLRVKCITCGLVAEDYKSDIQVRDMDLLHTGYVDMDGDLWARYTEEDNINYTRNGRRNMVQVPLIPEMDDLLRNDYLSDTAGNLLRFTGKDNVNGFFEDIGVSAAQSRKVWGIQARDIRQGMAIHSLMDPSIDLVCLLGSAGTGKTLITLAAALEMVLEKKMYERIIFSRTLQSQFEDIGFLPGNEHEKIAPWAGAAYDALEFMHKDDAKGAELSVKHLVEDRKIIQFKALNFIRGRSFKDTILIIDEAQNVNANQMKTILTRAGENCKVILLGNLAQIDNQYVTPQSSGLTYVTEKMKDNELASIVQLQGIVRSRLADFVEKNFN